MLRADAGLLPLEARLTPGDRSELGCEPWRSLAERPPNVPDGVTPHELWRWDPRGLPEVFNPVVVSATLGLDGTVYTVAGNEGEILVALDAEGRPRWSTEVGAVWGPPMALPDGRVAVAIRNPTEQILVLGNDGVRQRILPFGVLQVGPEGRLYVSRPTGRITALCAYDEGTVWDLDLPESFVQEYRTRADGALVMGGIPGRTPTVVHPDGSVESLDVGVAFDLDEEVGFYVLGGMRMVWIARSIGVRPEERTIEYYYGPVDGDLWPVPELSPDTSAGWLDSVGALWVYDDRLDRTARLRRYDVPAHLAFDRGDARRSPATHHTLPDGSLLTALGPVERVSPHDGSIVWRVALSETDAGVLGPSAISPDGVLYLATTDGFFAVQVDGVPGREGCAGAYCNGRQDRAERLFD